MQGFIVGVVVSACTLASSLVYAQPLEEITVEATRMVDAKPVSRSSIVNVKDLDLTSNVGLQELGKRIEHAAMAACKELGRQYPKSTPGDDECADSAAQKALDQFHERVNAAAK